VIRIGNLHLRGSVCGVKTTKGGMKEAKTYRRYLIASNINCVAGQSAIIRFGRGRRPRGPTYARGTIRSLFEAQEQARQRKAHDVATRPPCRNLFRDAHFEIIQFVCAVNQFIFSLSVQGSFLFIGSLSVLFRFRFQFHFRFSFVSFAVSLEFSL
jgi:hypothetical protein